MLGMCGAGDRDSAFRGRARAMFALSRRTTSGAWGGDRSRTGWTGGGAGGWTCGSRHVRGGMWFSFKTLTTWKQGP